MVNENVCYRELQDWKAAVIFVLRRWPVLLAVIIVVTAIFVKSRIDKGPDPLYTDTELESMQSELVQNENTIIENEGNIAVQQSTLAEQRKSMKSYQDTLAEAQQRLETAEDDSVRLSVSDWINATNVNIAAVQSQISATEQAINGNESEIATLKNRNEVIRQKLADIPQTVRKSELIKAFLIGCFAGMVAGWILLLFWYLFCDYLQNAGEISRVYGYYILGSVYMSKGKGAIGHLLDKWEGYPSKLDVKKEYDLICAHIELLCDEQGNELVVTGTVKPEKTREVAEQLSHFLSEKNYIVKAMENPVYNAASLRGLRGCSLILVEEKNISRKSEIAKLAGLLRKGQVNVQGVVEI